MAIAVSTWLYFLNKYSDYCDTFFFIARKKFNQVTFLHVYHHAIMPLYSYYHVRWLPGGSEIFSGWINAMVHVVMYSYYFLSALGPWIQPYLWWKKYITMIQLVQFFIALARSLILVSGVVECGFPWQVSFWAIILLEVPFIIMFLKFYMATYKKKPKHHENGTNARENGTNGRVKAE